MKLRLSVIGGSLHGRTFLYDTREIVMGRSRTCTLQFHPRRDSVVSARHARIYRDNETWMVEDLGSRNGTFVNGTRIQKAPIRDRDVIQLGPDGPQLVLTFPATDEERRSVPAAGATRRTRALPETLTHFSMYHPDRHRERERTGLGIATVLGMVLALFLFLILLLDLGPRGLMVGAPLALFPAPFYLLLFLWLDRYDPEPAWALVLAFGWGALFAVVVSYLLNTFFGTLFHTLAGGPAGETLTAVLMAPIFEEVSKGAGVLLFWLWLRREFDDVLDGIVYAGVIALGFASVENIFYYGRAYVEKGTELLLVTLVIRGVLSPFSHSLFTAMTGIGCGLARETHRRTVRILAPLLGFIAAMLLHGLWNAIAHFSGEAFFRLYVSLWVPLFMAFLGLVVYLLLRERRIIRQMLGDAAGRGVLTPEQVRLVTSFWKRTLWLLRALGRGDLLQRRRRFLHAATKLAFCYWHIQRARAARAQTLSAGLLPRFLSELQELRHSI